MATIAEIRELFDKQLTEKLANNNEVLKADFKEMFDAKFEDTDRKIKELEVKVEERDVVINNLRKDLEMFKRKNNVIFFKIKETEKSTNQLINGIGNLLRSKLDENFSDAEISNAYRFGKKTDEFRPICVTFYSEARMRYILSKRKSLKDRNVHLNADYPKMVLEARKKLQPIVNNLIAQGKKAVLRSDDIIVDGKRLENADIEVELQKLLQKRKRSEEIFNQENPAKQTCVQGVEAQEDSPGSSGLNFNTNIQ